MCSRFTERHRMLLRFVSDTIEMHGLGQPSLHIFSVTRQASQVTKHGERKDRVTLSSEYHVRKQKGTTEENVIKFVLKKTFSPRRDMLSPRTIIMLCQTGTDLFLPSFSSLRIHVLVQPGR